jgi:hypothetical protein
MNITTNIITNMNMNITKYNNEDKYEYKVKSIKNTNDII